MNGGSMSNGRCRFFFKLFCVAAAAAGVSSDNYLEGTTAALRCGVDKLHGNELETSTYFWKKGMVKLGGLNIIYYNPSNGMGVQVTDPSLVGRARFQPPVLSINDLKVNDSGYYSCEIVTQNGRFITKIIEVTVNAIPHVDVQRISNPTINKDTGLYNAAVCQALRSKPQASVHWINTKTGATLGVPDESIASADGTYNVTSVLRLKPGLIGRPSNSTHPVTADEMVENFTCVVTHDWFLQSDKQLKETVTIKLLYPPLAGMTIKGNRLTCDAIGNPIPSLTWTKPDGSITEGRRHIYVDQSTPDRSSGRYVCQVKSSIGPAVAMINIEEPEQLPTLLTTTLKYETTVPSIVRNYDIECRAELDRIKSLPTNQIFKWTRNGVDIEENAFYKQIVNTSVASAEKTIVSSTLRIVQVTKSIHGSIFKCRLDMIANGLSGYVRSVERVIKLKVDYPPLPGTISVSVHPHPAAQEGEDVALRCTAASSPPSSYRWFYEGREISSKSELVLKNVTRHEAGSYKCIAFNYVPGSATNEATVTVHYPPGDVVVKKSDNSLVCSTVGGSLPAPYYSWLLPNRTTTTKNTSILRISALDTSRAASYVCLVRNRLAEKNFTYFLPPTKLGIGSLSITEFSVTMVVVVLTIIALIFTILCCARRRNARKRSSSNSSSALKRLSLVGYTDDCSVDGSFDSSPAPHNVFDDDSIAEDKCDDVTHGNGSIRDSHGISSKLKSVETLDESGVEILRRCPCESPEKSVKPRPIITQMESRSSNGQLKLSTFSQPTNAAEFDGAMANYYTIRNPSRPKHEAALTRAFSETFKAGHLGLAPKNGIERGSNLSHYVSAAGQLPRVAHPPTYSQLTSTRNSATGSRKVASPSPFLKSTINGGAKEDRDSSRHDEVAKSSPKRSTSPATHEVLHKIGKIPQSKLTFRHDLTSPFDHGLRDTATPSRCQSVDTTHDTTSIVGMPNQTYTYQPYTDGSMTRTPTGVCTNQSTGTHSITSPKTVVGTNSGKLQSLTLV